MCSNWIIWGHFNKGFVFKDEGRNYKGEHRLSGFATEKNSFYPRPKKLKMLIVPESGKGISVEWAT